MIEDLLEANINFAVCANVVTAKAVPDMHSLDYFIVVNVKDKQRLEKIGIIISKDRESVETTSSRIISRNVRDITIHEADLLKFNEKKDLFHKVLHNEFGKVWEIKQKSFRDEYKKNLK